MKENYCLPIGYRDRLNNTYFDDTPYKDEFQDDVYSTAKNVLIENNYKTVIDIGTGSGFKLIKYFDNLKTIGVDLGPILIYLQKKYPNKIWCDLESINKEEEYDLIICSDVIEHIPNPDIFIEKINTINFKTIVFSTPDRINMYGGNHMGPPVNSSHVREWSMDEFNEYLNQHYLINKQLKSTPNSNTQIVICSKKI